MASIIAITWYANEATPFHTESFLPMLFKRVERSCYAGICIQNLTRLEQVCLTMAHSIGKLLILLFLLGSNYGFLHKHMSKDELGMYFQTNEHTQVDSNSYTVAPIQRQSVLAKRSENGETPDLAVSLEAFGQNFHLNLVQNKHLVHNETTVSTTTPDGTSTKKISKELLHCFYQVKDDRHYGGISTCYNSYEGYFIDGDSVVEISPLTNQLAQKAKRAQRNKRTGSTSIDSQYHLIKRTKLSEFRERFGPLERSINMKMNTSDDIIVKKRGLGCGKPDLYLELGITMDREAYLIFNHQKKLQSKNGISSIILLIINGMNAIYHHPTLGRAVNFVVNNIEIMDGAAPYRTDGERQALLTAFCQYYAEKNKDRKYDLGVLFSGIDMWAPTARGEKSMSTMGLSAVGTVCNAQWSCVIAETGVRDKYGQAYPSTGFNMVYITGHEIGHNIGIHHDGHQVKPGSNEPDVFKTCELNGFVMSPTRGPEGETPWSSCSRNFLCYYINAPCMENKGVAPSDLDHVVRYGLTPGMYYTASDHCKFLMDGEESAQAINKNMADICDKGIQCEVASKNRIEYSGPALQGTSCGPGKVCMNNECVGATGRQAVLEPSWGEWSETGGCSGGCVSDSKGYQTLTRTCLFSGDGAKEGDCVGPTTKVELCDNPDKSGCLAKDTAIGYASAACSVIKTDFTEVFGQWISGQGFQKEYDETDPNRACQIYCSASKGGSKSPAEIMTKYNRLDLAYFPDGTPCHKVKDFTFYCQGRACVNPSGRGQRSSSKGAQVVTNVGFQPGPDVEKYLTLDENGNPLSNIIPEVGDGTNTEFQLEDGFEIPTA